MKTISNWSKQYGSVFRIWLGNYAIIVLSNPDDVQEFLTHPASTRKSELMVKVGKDFFGDGVLLSAPSKWKPRRKQVQSTFSNQIVQSFIPTFVKQSNILVQCLKEHVEKNPFDISMYFCKASLDAICGTAMGIEMSSQTSDHIYPSISNRLLQIATLRLTQAWLYFDTLFYLSSAGKEFARYLKTMNEFAIQVISNRSRIRADENNNEFSIIPDFNEKKLPARKIFLDYFMDLKNTDSSFLDKDLLDEVNTLLGAGFETTAITNAFVLLLLAIHTDIQQKVFDEIYDIFGDSDRNCTKEDLSKLEYLEMVVKEVLRMYPTVPMFIRQPDVDVRIPSGIIPAGATVCVYSIGIHRDRNIWKDADQFNPMRFTREENATRHPYSYVPFAAGARNCIGYQYAYTSIKTQISTILRSYRVSTFLKEEDIRLEFLATLRTATGFPIQLHNRNTFC